MSLKTTMIGLEFKNPVMAGCAGITERAKTTERWLKAGAGGILAKTITSDAKLRTYIRPTFYNLGRFGHERTMTQGELLSTFPPKVWLKEEAPRFADLKAKYGVPWIQSIVGQGLEYDDWSELAQLVESAGVDAIELDLCCPLAPGESEEYSLLQLGEDPVHSAKVTAAVKKAVKVPVGVKLSPTVYSLGRVAKACQEDGGASYCSAVNCPAGFHIDVENEDILGANTLVAYMPGPSLKWWGLWKVTQIRDACDIEISGVGGIWTAEDALQYLLLGCRTLQIVSSVYFEGPDVFPRIINGIAEFMERKGYSSIEDFRGKVYQKLLMYRDVTNEEVIALNPTAIIARIDKELCTWCGLCEKTCIHEAVRLDETADKAEVGPNDCVGCGFCAGYCPAGAIDIVHRQTGRSVWKGEGPVTTTWVEW